jgi:hypothetical protein
MRSTLAVLSFALFAPLACAAVTADSVPGKYRLSMIITEFEEDTASDTPADIEHYAMEMDVTLRADGTYAVVEKAHSEMDQYWQNGRYFVAKESESKGSGTWTLVGPRLTLRGEVRCSLTFAPSGEVLTGVISTNSVSGDEADLALVTGVRLP